jgi:hypothetical protein
VARRARQGKVELPQFRPLVVAVDAVADGYRDELRRLLRPPGGHSQRGRHAEQRVAVKNMDDRISLVRGLVILRKRHRQDVASSPAPAEELVLPGAKERCTDRPIPHLAPLSPGRLTVIHAGYRVERVDRPAKHWSTATVKRLLTSELFVCEGLA